MVPNLGYSSPSILGIYSIPLMLYHLIKNVSIHPSNFGGLLSIFHTRYVRCNAPNNFLLILFCPKKTKIHILMHRWLDLISYCMTSSFRYSRNRFFAKMCQEITGQLMKATGAANVSYSKIKIKGKPHKRFVTRSGWRSDRATQITNFLSFLLQCLRDLEQLNC